jgi:DNA-binding protein HU-beta
MAKPTLHMLLFLTVSLMTKQDLINSAASAAGVTKKAAADVIDSLLRAITSSLAKGENVTITGFGTFRVSSRAARTGVNPRNPSQKIQIPAMKLPAFKAGKGLKDAVR